MNPNVHAAGLASLLLAALLGACGARSAPFFEPCSPDQGLRPCRNDCGEGLQECIAGRWSACDVPPVEMACVDACGEGVALCVDGVMGACAVPPVTLACEDACGSGTQLCVDGALGPCVVPSTEVACTNVCGEGTAICQDGIIAPCRVEPRELPCTNACGDGVAFCAEGILGGCEVAPTRVACDGICGAGTADCAGGVVGVCETPPRERFCSTECGEGVEVCERERWGPCSADLPLPPALEVTVRDFNDTHPDFQAFNGTDRGIVENVLGADDKPVYAGPSPTTTGRVNYDQWYRDTPGVNLSTSIDLELTPSPGDPDLFVFDDQTFFPIDGQLFGNQGRDRNFHFTLEAVTEFIYQGGETFRFRGDDDVWVFINRRLAIDLGGVHATQEATVSLDARRRQLGLVLGERYSIHLFFAERMTTGSTFTVETTVANRIRCAED